jgi:alpha-L-rhamnosidase
MNGNARHARTNWATRRKRKSFEMKFRGKGARGFGAAVLLACLIFLPVGCRRAAVPREPLGVGGLSVEDGAQPVGLETGQPRYSWKLESGERGVAQTHYQLRLFQSNSTETPLWDSGREASGASHLLAPGHPVLRPHTAYRWQVRVWDNQGRESAWSGPGEFSTGYLGEAWPAAWIGDGRHLAAGEDAPAARYLRGSFPLEEAPARAMLYVTALGLVEPWVNGVRVSGDYFQPGWPDYRKRVFTAAHDVTAQLCRGANVLGLILADGWYSGTLMKAFRYGDMPLASAWLEIEFTDGRRKRVVTGGDWFWATGPVTQQAIYHGETRDAQLENPAWALPGEGGAWNWRPVVVAPPPGVQITPRVSPPVRVVERLRPVGVREIAPGRWIYDFGQNLTGWTELTTTGHRAGSDIVQRYGEMLNADGTLYTENLRTARTTARYIPGAETRVQWQPSFTYFGFRYVELTGLDAPDKDTLTACVVHSDLPRTGSFTCSHPGWNQLFSNLVWGQRGNFLELPTDCPQRNERLGWTGDAQVFCATASTNMACGPFYRQWLRTLCDSYLEDEQKGGFPDVAPQTSIRSGTAGWGDAGVIVPYVAWRYTGDRTLLEESWPRIRDWMELQQRQAPEGIRTSPHAYGDWLSPGYKPGKAPPSNELVSTAYFGQTARLAAEIARELGRGEDAERYEELHRKIRAAFCAKFIQPDGTMEDNCQTAYLLALEFDLVPDNLRGAVVENLFQSVEEKDRHLATGFLGTPLLGPVLTRLGRVDLAYAVALKETYPGWLFSVKNGATTMWERWDSWTPEKGFGDVGMNSFNHYAYGAIGEWLYGTVAGLGPAAPGWKVVRIHPQPGGGLAHARASVETPHGTAECGWERSAHRMTLRVRIPPNATGEVSLPARRAQDVVCEGKGLSQLGAVSRARRDGAGIHFDLAAGSYVFQIENPIVADDGPALP